MSEALLDAPLTIDEAMRIAVSESISRQLISRAMGQTYEGKRDLARAFGYKDEITVTDYRLRYERGGIASSIVETIVKATWRGGVELVEDDDEGKTTPFEAAWDALATRLHVVAKLQAGDILSRIGSYAVLLIGAPGEVTEELPRGNGTPDSIAYLQPYCGSGGAERSGAQRTFAEALAGIFTADAIIDSIDSDPTSPRFGQPKGYRLRRTDVVNTDFSAKVVHWSRVVHLAEDCLDDSVYGKPALRAVWNDLDNLDKVVGGGSEAFFQQANPPRLWSFDKDMKGLTEPQLTSFREQIEKLEHQMIRDVRSQGVNAKNLNSNVANFANQVDSLISLIAGTIRLPKRILIGSEMGELASSQDRDNFRDQVNGRREQHAGPYVLRRFVDRLLDYNYLPKPKEYAPRWGSVLNLTEDEKRTKAQGWSTTNVQLKNAGQPPAFLMSEIRGLCYEMAPYTSEQLAEERDLLPEPEPVVPAGAFPRAAAADDEVERLAAAIEAGDVEEIGRLVGIPHGE